MIDRTTPSVMPALAERLTQLTNEEQAILVAVIDNLVATKRSPATSDLYDVPVSTWGLRIEAYTPELINRNDPESFPRIASICILGMSSYMQQHARLFNNPDN